MAIGRPLSTLNMDDYNGGCNYDPDITSLVATESPNAMNIDFLGTRIRKRKGFRQINDTVTGHSDYGHSLYDFKISGAGHNLVAHFGTKIYKMDNLDGTFDTLLSSAPDVTSYNTEVKQNLIQTYDNNSNEYYWNGTDSTMKILSSSAPGFKHCIEFQGYLLGGNIASNKLRIYYEDINTMIGGSYSDYFTLTGAQDDELTGFFLINGRCYAGTDAGIFRISYIGGVAVFEYKQVISDVGVVPRTLRVVVTNDFGQIAIFLGTDKNVYLFDGSYIRIISKKYREANNDTEFALEYIDDNYINNAHATYDYIKQIYRLFVTVKGKETNTHTINIDVEALAYYPYDNMAFASSIMAKDDLNRPFFIAADYAGRVHKMFPDHNSDNGKVILEYYESPLLMPRSQNIKKSATIDMYFKPVANYRLRMDDKTDFDKTWSNRAHLDMFKNRDKFLGSTTTLGTTFKLGSENEVLRKSVNIPVTNNGYRFKLYTDDGVTGRYCYYITGTVSGTGGGTTVSGTGTTWQSYMTSANGWKIHIKSGDHANTTYDFDYTSSSSGTVSTMEAGDFSGAEYELYKTGCASCAEGWELMKVDYNTQILSVGTSEVRR